MANCPACRFRWLIAETSHARKPELDYVQSLPLVLVQVTPVDTEMVHLEDYLPSLSLWRTSIRQRAKEYLFENTLHGIPYFVDSSRPTAERLIWFLCTIASLVAGLTAIATIWEKFQTSPILMQLHIEAEESSTDFPSVFLCFESAQLDLSKNLNPKQQDVLKSLYQWDWSPLETDNEQMPITEYGAFFLNATPDCESFYSKCQFGIQDLSCKKFFTRKVVTGDGVCCVFPSIRLEKTNSSKKFMFLPQQYPLRLHVLEEAYGVPQPSKFPFRLSSSVRVQLNPIITFTDDNVQFLTRNQRQCSYASEVSLSECLKEALSQKLMEKCKCLPWFYAKTPSEHCPLKKYDCLSTIDYDECFAGSRCFVPCDHTAYTFTKVTYGLYKDGTSEIEFVRWPDVRFRRSIRFGWLDLLVSFGGIAGLCLGYSILTSVETLYYFSLRPYCGAVLSAPKKRHNIRVEVKGKVTPDLVKLKQLVHYYDYID